MSGRWHHDHTKAPPKPLAVRPPAIRTRIRTQEGCRRIGAHHTKKLRLRREIASEKTKKRWNKGWRSHDAAAVVLSLARTVEWIPLHTLQTETPRSARAEWRLERLAPTTLISLNPSSPASTTLQHNCNPPRLSEPFSAPFRTLTRLQMHISGKRRSRQLQFVGKCAVALMRGVRACTPLALSHNIPGPI
jgi:hypothetical protein